VSALFAASITLQWFGRGPTNVIDDLGEAGAAFVAVCAAFLAARRSIDAKRGMAPAGRVGTLMGHR
jgi:hypothetical protein